jgi:hypothetical protein
MVIAHSGEHDLDYAYIKGVVKICERYPRLIADLCRSISQLKKHKAFLIMSSLVRSNHSSLGATALAVTWAECGLGTVSFALTVYTNGWITKRWKSDFWWCLTTYVSSIFSHSTSIIKAQWNGVRYSPFSQPSF